MKFTKPALSQQQLLSLMQQRGLPLTGSEDVTLARRALDRIGYFRLSGFMGPFVLGGSGLRRHEFRREASISKLVALHDFDAGLRALCLEGLAPIEVAMRVSICDHLSRVHGPHWPLKSSPFRRGKHAGHLDALAKAAEFNLSTGQPQPRQSRTHQFLTRYYARYTDPATRMPPGWMIRECASFRTWAHLFEGLEASEQKQISDAWRFPSGKRIDHSVLQDWFHSLSVFRNRCAHHGRIVHRAFPFAPVIPQDPSVAPLFHGSGTDLRTLLVVMAILLKSIELQGIWMQKLRAFFELHTSVSVAAAIGFSSSSDDGWRDDPLWRL